MGFGVKSKFLSMELDSASTIADAGYFISIAHNFTGPTTTFIGYPKEWISEYTEKSYVLSDPALHWTSFNSGIARWSEFGLPDPANVLNRAKTYGINYGASCSIILNNKRSIATFGRKETEFSDIELRLLSSILEKIHIACFPDRELTELEVKTLRLVADGHTMVETSKILGVSKNLVISRMQNIRSKFSAQTNLEALAIAMRMKILE